MPTETATSLTTILPPPADSNRQAQTRLRLLEAAAREFAEHGFHHSTVRDICKRANANVAAVNYHFGDKEGLYSATLKHWISYALEAYPLLMGVAADAPAVDRLRGFVRGTLHRMLCEASSGWHGQLMAREMVEPTAAFDELVSVSLKPMADLLHGIVRDIVGPAIPDPAVRTCALSVIGQCCFYRHAREVITRMYGADAYTPASIELIADHITRFSLAGFTACTQLPAVANCPGIDASEQSLTQALASLAV